MPSRIAQDGDIARTMACASAMRLLMGSHVRCALRHGTGPSAKHSVHTARAARMDSVRPTGHVRASQASLATCATSARRAYSEMLVRTNVQGTARVLVTGDASEMTLVHAIWCIPARVATSVRRARRVEIAKRPVHGM